jgi:hypothetical protein
MFSLREISLTDRRVFATALVKKLANDVSESLGTFILVCAKRHPNFVSSLHHHYIVWL